MEWTDSDLLAIENAGTAGDDRPRKRRHRPPARARWDRRHLVTMTTKLRRREAQELRLFCEAANTTPYALMRKLLREWSEAQRQYWS